KFNLSASCFELCLDLFSFVLGSAFLDSLRSCFNEVLSFLEAETSDRANFLDHVDLVCATVSENDVKLGLFFSSSSRSSASSSNCYRSSSRNAPLFFQKLRKFCSFENGQSRQVVNDLCE